MSTDIIIAEYYLWLDNLTSSTATLSAALENSSDKNNTEILQCYLDYMTVDAQELEKFRPSSDKKVVYDFTTALRPLANAKRLSARTQTILAAKKNITKPERNSMFLISEVVSKANDINTTLYQVQPQDDYNCIAREEAIPKNNLPTTSFRESVALNSEEKLLKNSEFTVKEEDFEIIDIEDDDDDLSTDSVPLILRIKTRSCEIEQKKYNGELHQSEHRNKTQKGKKREHQCNLCSKTYSSDGYVRRHMRLKH